MDVKTIGEGLVNLCQQGKFEEAMHAYYSPDITSIENAPGSEGEVVHGMEACAKKGEHFMSVHTVNGMKVEGPFVNRDQFTVHYTMDLKKNDTGDEFTMVETGLYTVKDGKIVEEVFFY